MDVQLLERIVKLMAANDLNTVDVRDGLKRVILKLGVAVVSAPPMASHASPGSFGATPAAPAADESDLIPIKSPMVGTFYAAASPDAKPFVQVGSNIDEESDVCIIE